MSKNTGKDSGPRKRLIIVYDEGAAGPTELTRSLSPGFDLAFVMCDSDHARSVAGIFEPFGHVFQMAQVASDLIDELWGWGADGIVTYSESIRQTAALAEQLSLGFHSLTVAERLTDKWTQRSRLRARNVDDTRSALIEVESDLDTALRHVGFPAVVKPARGRGSHNTFFLRDWSDARAQILSLLELDTATKRTNRYVVEEFLEGVSPTRRGIGDYVSVETLVRRTSIDHISITGKFPLVSPFRESGQFWPAVLSNDCRRGVLALVTDAIAALDVRHGILHTEVKLTPVGPRIIEMNGRLGGWVADLCGRSGCGDIIELAGRSACGDDDVGLSLPDPAKITFQFSNLAPCGSQCLEQVIGGSEVRRLDGVDRYLKLVAPGPLAGWGATQELDLICGHAASTEEMIDLLTRAVRLLRFRFSDAVGGSALHSAEDLPAWQSLIGVSAYG